MSEDGVAAAQRRASLARSTLADALVALKHRLLPRTIARNLLETTKIKAADTVEAGTEAVKAQPAIVVGVAALVALLAARKPIGRKIKGAISGGEDETPPPLPRSPGRSRKAKS